MEKKKTTKKKPIEIEKKPKISSHKITEANFAASNNNKKKN